MHVDLGTMAQALGIRENQLRITLGIPTPLQRLVRMASTFLEIVDLDGKFAEDRNASCGPKFEEEEKEEYLARRKTLFPDYLAGFNTIEEFLTFGHTKDGRHSIPLMREEQQLASAKLKPLLYAELESAGEDLKALLELRETMYFFLGKRWLSNENLSHDVHHALQRAFLMKLRSTTDTLARLAILEEMPVRRYDLFGDHRGDGPWRFVWEEVKTLEEGFALEKSPNKGDYIDKGAVKIRLLELLEEKMKTLNTFEGRLTFALRLEKRDFKGPDTLYSRALESAAEKAEDIGNIGRIVQLWEERGERNTTYRDRWPGLPIPILEKLDDFWLEEAERSENLERLANLMNSPWGTKTHEVAEKKLRAHFDEKIGAAQTKAEVEEVQEEAKRLSVSLRIRTYDRIKELEDAAEEREAEESLVRVRSGEDPDPKSTLIALYRHYSEKKEMEKTKQIAFFLAPHFPAETVEEISIETP